MSTFIDTLLPTRKSNHPALPLVAHMPLQQCSTCLSKGWQIPRLTTLASAALSAGAVVTAQAVRNRRKLSAAQIRPLGVRHAQLRRHDTDFSRGNACAAATSRRCLADQDVQAPPRPPRVRFAPSPTGVLHVGGARTALFNWLYAKSQGGEMILRIEDTDAARSTGASEDAILEGLKWCGLTWDEGPDVGGNRGPYRQSERLEAGIYQEALDKLISGGHAYRCFLTEQELDEMRAEAERDERPFIVDSKWASATEAEVQEMLDKNVPYVYRFRLPRNRIVEIEDAVLGEVDWSTDALGGDFVIVRQNGMPMYNFAVVIDDAQMEITHVMRAQEHLMNTPRQICIYEALGLSVPVFAHMPLILAPDRSKLSKRHGATSVQDYKRMGYLPSGMVNYLAQLGWNDGTNKEIYVMDELRDAFSMKRMSKVAAIFDTEKFRWVNGHHVRELSDEQAASKIGAELVEKGMIKEANGVFLHRAAVLLRDRVSVLSEAAEELQKHMQYPLEEMLASEKGKAYVEDGSLVETAKLLLEAKERGDLDSLAEDPGALKTVVKAIGEARGVKKKALVIPLRLCLTAATAGPDMGKLFHMMSAVDDNVTCEYATLDQRLELLRESCKSL